LTTVADPPDIRTESAASDACTRSGAFALLISVGLVLLIPFWLDRPAELARGEYISARLNLSLLLERLDDDPKWQQFVKTHGDAESRPLARLMDLPQVSPAPTSNAPNRPAPPAQHRAKTSHQVESPVLPEPPTNLVVHWVGPAAAELPDIAARLAKLNDSRTLTLAREGSNYFDNGIVHWLNKRNSIVTENMAAGVCTPKVVELPYRKPPPEYFVPALDADALLQCLAVRDIRRLSQIELPSVLSPPQFGEHVTRQVDVTLGALPQNLYWASVVG
jgi:hypothetical protein